MAVVSRLGALLVERGICQEEFADMIGMTRQNFNRIVTGKTRSCMFDSVDRMCKVLECGLTDIYDFVPDDELTGDEVIHYLEGVHDDYEA